MPPADNKQGSGTIGSRLADIRRRIEAAAKNVGRAPGDVSLIAVSKTVEPTNLQAAIAAGQRLFGENRVQEALSKWPELKRQTPGLELHLIGPLQTNKLRDALSLFDVLQTLDRESLALALVRAREGGAVLPLLYVQINIGREPQKAGVMPDLADDFLCRCREEWKLPIEGLMCIPPFDEEPRPYFESLRNIVRRNGIQNLSMGMSGDFEKAIQMGATHVRVGTAIFGERA